MNLSDELFLEDIIPGPQESDDETFSFLPVGAKFVRANKTKGWVREFSVVNYQPLEGANVLSNTETDILNIPKYHELKQTKYGNNTIFFGDFKLLCELSAHNKIFNGFNSEKSLEIKTKMEESNYRAAGFFRLFQPGFRHRRQTCGNYGAFVHQGRKDADFCKDPKPFNRVNSNVLSYWFGLKLQPFMCTIG